MSSKYYTTDELYFSTMYGGGIYEWSGRMVQDPIGGDNGSGCVSPLLINKVTNESYFMKRMKGDIWEQSKVKKLILDPPGKDCILCPSDLLLLSEEQCKKCSLFVAQEYTENLTSPEDKEGSYAVLFPYGGYPKLVSGSRVLSQISNPTWKNPEIRKMAIQILKAVERLNRTGYVYADIHLSRFFFREDGTVYLNFSNLIFSFKYIYSVHSTKLCSVEQGEYPIEFAEPAIVSGRQAYIDFNTQNYSLCALMFYLFFGRYAYDGRLLTGYVDDNLQKHYVKFRDYHKMPVFIFDPGDHENALGAFDEEQQVIDLWEECPDELRQLFVMTLQKRNAEREETVFNPTPAVWLKYLRKVGWLQDEGKDTEV